jgi:hypothetical protein
MEHDLKVTVIYAGKFLPFTGDGGDAGNVKQLLAREEVASVLLVPCGDLKSRPTAYQICNEFREYMERTCKGMKERLDIFNYEGDLKYDLSSPNGAVNFLIDLYDFLHSNGNYKTGLFAFATIDNYFNMFKKRLDDKIKLRFCTVYVFPLKETIQIDETEWMDYNGLEIVPMPTNNDYFDKVDGKKQYSLALQTKNKDPLFKDYPPYKLDDQSKKRVTDKDVKKWFQLSDWIVYHSAS